MAIRLLGIFFSAGFSLLCGTLGWDVSKWYLNLEMWAPRRAMGAESFAQFQVFITIAFIALGLLVGFAIASVIYRQLSGLFSVSAPEKVAALAGLVAGLVVAGLLQPFFNNVLTDDPTIKAILTVMIYLLCIYGGVVLALSMKNELAYMLTRPPAAGEVPVEIEEKLSAKLLDTNVIIDGRITDICRAGFIEGTIFIPGFVLEELQLIADSSDNLRRARGRRGLDVLSALQKDLKNVRVYDKYTSPMPRSEAVDMKLVRLAKELDAIIITNDYNLNKVASLQDIQVLNVNELAAALKPVVLPGEEMNVMIVREGKELNQGVAYLDDGTMVVVEGGKQHINESLPVIVSSVLQTVAGKMIFANLKSDAQSSYDDQDTVSRHRNDRGSAASRK